MVSGLTLKSSICPEVILVSVVRNGSTFIILHVNIQFSSSTHWRDYLFSIKYSRLPCQTFIDCICMGFFPGLLILFYLSMCLFLMPVTYYFINILWNQEVWYLQLCLLSQDCFGYSGSFFFLLLLLCMNFGVFSPFFCKKYH